MGSVIRSHGWGGASGNEVAPRVTKSTAVLSDGTQVAMLVDRNQTGVTGDGGDNSGIPRAYIYTAPAGTPGGSDDWTLQSSFATDDSSSMSMAVDSMNNLHICWHDASKTGQEIYYRRLTYSTATGNWTHGPRETAFSIPTGQNCGRLDIDALGTSTTSVVISTLLGKPSPNGSMHLKMLVRTTGGTWRNNETSIFSGSRQARYVDSVSVSSSTAGAVSNVVSVAVAFPRVRETNNEDYGDCCLLYRINISTGNIVGDFTRLFPNGFATGLNGGHREYKLFCTASSGTSHTWVLVGCVGDNPWTAIIGKSSYNQSTNTVTRNVNLQTVSHGIRMYRRDPQMWVDFIYHNNTVTMIGIGNTQTYAKVLHIVGNRIEHLSTVTAWDDRYKALGTVPARVIRAGTARNHDTAHQPSWTGYTRAGNSAAYRIESTPKVVGLFPIHLTPIHSVFTSEPELGAQIRARNNTPQYQVKVEWQIAPQSGSFDNPQDVTTVTEPNSKFIQPFNTAWPTYAVQRTYYKLPAIQSLPQGAYKMRARHIDAAMTPTNWSHQFTFSVAHVPSATGLTPNGNVVTNFGSIGRTTFNWRFSDPYPGDSQTAYELVVENAATRAVILNTGKVLSSASSVSLNLPSSVKDIPLRWRIRLWDQGDVMGPYSGYATFVPSSSPTPSIVDPTSGGQVNTAIPMITWNPGVGDIKTQWQFDLTISIGQRVVWRTRQISDRNSIRVPVCYLENDSTYYVTIRVTDNLRLEGHTSTTFHTQWPLPDVIDGLAADPSSFNSRGFVWMTQHNTSFDEDVIGVNLYRRKITENDWTHVHTWSNTTKVMTYRDYLVTPDVEYEYASTQIVDRFGDVIESERDPEAVVSVSVSNANYWLIRSIENATLGAIPLFHVNADQFTDEYESESYNLIGRGRHTDYGDRLGYSGSLSAQLRPRFMSQGTRTNLAHNPGQRMLANDSTDYPDLWTPYLHGGGIVGDLRILREATEQIDPAFTGESFSVSSSSFGILGRQVGIEFNSPVDEARGEPMTYSVWVYDTAKYDGIFDFGMLVYYYNEVGAIVASTARHDNEHVEEVGLWRRYAMTRTVPATAVRLMSRIYLTGTGTIVPEAKITANAAQNEHGGLTPYTDGNQFDGVWKATPEYSASISDGYYSARQQRLDIEALKNDRLDVFLRGPFGDLWRVAVGNLQFSRLAGTGNKELTDVTIPYEEVSGE